MSTVRCEEHQRCGRARSHLASAIVLGCLLILGGCELLTAAYNLGDIADPSNVEAVFAGTTISDDVHRRRLVVEAPLVGSGRDTYKLIAALAYDENRRPHHQTYVLAVYVSADDWLFLDHVYSYGQPFPVVSTHRELVDCYTDGTCLITENVMIALYRDDLVRFARTGFAFEVSGSGGSREFFVPAGYFAGFLHRVQLILEEKKPPSPAGPTASPQPSASDPAAPPERPVSSPARRPGSPAHRQPQDP